MSKLRRVRLERTGALCLVILLALTTLAGWLS